MPFQTTSLPEGRSRAWWSARCSKTSSLANSSSSSSSGMCMRGLLCLLGGVLLQIALGTVYTFGVSSIYFLSFLKGHSDPALRLSAAASIMAAEFSATSLSMPLGGLLERRCGPRVGCLLGGGLFVSGVFLSTYTVKSGFLWFLLTYAVLYGVGLGIAYPSPLVAALRWFPNHQASVCLNFFCLGGNFSLFPTATGAVFGRAAVGQVYGFVYMAQLGSSVVTAVVMPVLTEQTEVWRPFCQQQQQKHLQPELLLQQQQQQQLQQQHQPTV
ncbi:hypothetical protein Efla_006713 [Eimeria flavescens]